MLAAADTIETLNNDNDMSNLSNEQLENLLTLAQAASPGPWYMEARPRKNRIEIQTSTREPRLEYEGWNGFIEVNGSEEQPKQGMRVAEANAEYLIATQPRTVRLLIQELLQHRAAHATGVAGEAVLDADQIALLRDNADFCNARTRELLDRLLAHYNVLRAALTPAPAPAPQPAASRCGSGGVDAWILCDGKADYQAEEEWVWVTMPNGEVRQAMYKEACWEDESEWLDGGRYKEPAMKWAECTDEGPTWETLVPQPTHFQPKPTPPSCPRTCRTCRAAGDAGEAKGGGVEA